MRTKAVRGFQTGDMVRAELPHGKKAGVHLGRVAVRASGLSQWAMQMESTPSIAKFSIARTAMATAGGPLPPRPERRGF
jgi:hypothetical protein